MTGTIAWLAATSLSQGLARNALAFPVLETLHVLAMSLVLGTVIIFDARLLALGWRDWPAGHLLTTLRKLALSGFVLAALSGVALFLSQPETYAHNLPFLVKLGLLGAAGVNLVLFETVYGRAVAGWHIGAAIPLGARVLAVVSLALWAGILVAGRFIGFFLLA